MTLRAAIFLLALATGFGAAAQEASVTGTATYRERMALPPDAVFEAVLEDISRADAPAVALGRFASGPTLQVPTPFAIPYDPARIDPAGRYALRARILAGGRPLFVSDAPVPVLTQGAPARAELLLRRFGAAPGAASAPAPGPRKALRGLYRYAADAGQFADCATGAILPVAPEADNAALERAYAAAPHAPGADVLVELDGRVAERPKADGAGTRPSLLVDRFRGAWPGESCGAPGAPAALRGTYWRLTRLEGRPVVARPDRREPHLVLGAGDDRVSGAGGCNAFSGSYAVSGPSIRLRPLAATMMACADGMERERAFLAALGRVQRWQVSGQHLELKDDAGRMLARFEARAPR
jgi:uncharacterized lipoprotein YbaY/heat shock protein HslJ